MSDAAWDVIVIGSGAVGLTAAVTAARGGSRVLVVEKADMFGGTTAISGGGIWIPGNHHQRAAGLAEPDGAARRYIEALVGGDLRGDVLDGYLRAGPEMVRFLEDETEVRFALADHSPDWHPDLDGASPDGRLLRPLEYRSTRLGRRADELRPPRAEFNAPGGFMIDLPDLAHIAKMRSSPGSMLYLARLVARYGRDRLRGHSRGTRLTMGSALAARLFRSAIDAGVAFRADSSVVGLARGDRGIVVVRVLRDGRPATLPASRGVVLATGGFSANPQQRRAYMPYPDRHVSIMAGGNTGDGIEMGLETGGVIDGENVANGVWSVVSTMARADGSTAIYAHLIDMAKPGCIAIDKGGRRFGNEASNAFVEAMHATGAVPAWLVADAAFVRRYGLGLAYPGGRGLGKLVAAGYMAKAATPAELASRIGVDPTGLQATIAAMNRYAGTGRDPDFHKGESALDRDLGDPGHRPNPCLGPISTAPFYAIEIVPGDGSTTVGLRIDAHARVLGPQGQPIAGLYAAGLDAHSIWRGDAPAHGCNLGPAMAFGYIAGRELAASEPFRS